MARMVGCALLVAPCALSLAIPASAQSHAATPVAASTAAIDPVALDYARQIVATILPAEQRMAMMESITRSLLDQMRSALLDRAPADPGLRQILNGYLNAMPERMRPVRERQLPLMVEAMAHAYTREFSPDELRQILAFAKTDTGKRYFSRSSALLADPEVAAANRAYIAAVSEAARSGENELKADVARYLAKHPEIAGKSAKP